MIEHHQVKSSKTRMLSLLQLAEEHKTSSALLKPFFIATIALTLTIFLLKKRSSTTIKSLTPPSPPKLPVIGNFHQLGSLPHRSLHSLAQTHGPIMLLHFGSVPVLIISSPELAREIMKTHDLIFANRPPLRIFRVFTYGFKDIATAPHGEYWRQIKSICVVHLLSNKRVQSFKQVREEETALMIEKIKNSSSPVNLSELLMKLTCDIVCRVALGRKYYDEKVKGGRTFGGILRDTGEVSGRFDFGDYIPSLSWVMYVNGFYGKVKRLAKEFDDLLDKVVEEHIDGDFDRRDDGNRHKDLVDVLLWIQKENMAGGFNIDRTCIKAIILDVFAAGTDTTSTLLEWTMTELLRHPQILEKLTEELRENFKNKSFITENDLINKTHYLKAVIKETLRLHPPVPLLLPRVSTQDLNLKGFKIASGTQVIVNAFAIGNDSVSWDNPEAFLPDRFLNSSIDFRGHDFELIPFGSGRRICPGIQFAVSAVELVLANLLYKFDWSVHGDVDVSECIGVNVRKKLPLFAIATPYYC